MIKLSRRDGSVIFLNPDLLEAIEVTPDTILTLSNGNRHLVNESAAEIIDRIIEFKASIQRRAMQPERHGAAADTAGDGEAAG